MSSIYGLQKQIVMKNRTTPLSSHSLVLQLSRKVWDTHITLVSIVTVINCLLMCTKKTSHYEINMCS